MTAKLRVYEVARDLGMDQKQLVALLQSSGVPDVRNHMSAIGADVVERIRRQLEKQ
jgi:translation initiation factor IF-2